MIKNMSPEQLALYQQHQANVASVSERLTNHQRLSHYLFANRTAAVQMWSTPEIVRRLKEEPDLLGEVDANPETQLKSLFAQHPPPPPQPETSSCCLIL